MNKIKKIIKNLVENEILCKAASSQNDYHITENLAQLLETFTGAEIIDNELPPIWKRKAAGELTDDPELNQLATEIYRHEQEN